MIKKTSLFVLLIFCFTFIYTPKANALEKGSHMFWGILFTLGAVGSIGGMVGASVVEDDTGFAIYMFSLIGCGIIASMNFNSAFKPGHTALLNIEKDKFVVSVPDLSYSISKKEGTVRLFKYSF